MKYLIQEFTTADHKYSIEHVVELCEDGKVFGTENVSAELVPYLIPNDTGVVRLGFNGRLREYEWSLQKA